ncbi:MAG: hypothetical protein RL719_113, partial [Actinomycetota bacterium]
PTTLQIGLGSDALVLQNLKAEQEKLINLLYRGVADGSIHNISRTLGSSDEDTGELLTRLSPALLDVPDQDSGKLPALSDAFIGQAFAEIIRASFSTGVDGVSVLRTRTARLVSLESGDKASLLLALGLAAAGVGALTCADDSPVMPEDVGPLGYDQRELGSPRRDALARKLEEGVHPCRLVSGPARSRVLAAAVFVGNRFVAPERYRQAMRGSTPHICVEFGAEETKVSPLVVPGSTPCLSCRHAQELARDADWAMMATQLQFRHERLDDSQASLIAMGMTLELLLGYLDDPRTSRFEGKIIDHKTGQIRSNVWSKDPLCECSTSTESVA